MLLTTHYVLEVNKGPRFLKVKQETQMALPESSVSLSLSLSLAVCVCVYVCVCVCVRVCVRACVRAIGKFYLENQMIASAGPRKSDDLDFDF